MTCTAVVLRRLSCVDPGTERREICACNGGLLATNQVGGYVRSCGTACRLEAIRVGVHEVRTGVFIRTAVRKDAYAIDRGYFRRGGNRHALIRIVQ